MRSNVLALMAVTIGSVLLGASALGVTAVADQLPVPAARPVPVPAVVLDHDGLRVRGHHNRPAL